MADETTVKYKATPKRGQVRTIYKICEELKPGHKAAARWMNKACEELFDAALVEVKADAVVMKAMSRDEKLAVVSLTLSRDAVLGIKYAVLILINGDEKRGILPASRIERRELLEIVGSIGPEGKLLRLIEKEIKLPEPPDIDEDLSELDEEAPPAPAAASATEETKRLEKKEPAKV